MGGTASKTHTGVTFRNLIRDSVSKFELATPQAKYDRSQEIVLSPRRQCVLHKTINVSFEICIHVYTMSMFHWKYKQFRRVRKFNQDVNISLEIYVKMLHLINHVNISLEICAKAFHLIKHVNVSLEICTIVVGSCADPSKMLIFHCKYL